MLPVSASHQRPLATLGFNILLRLDWKPVCIQATARI